MNYSDMLLEIDVRGEGLTQWEIEFVNSLIDRERFTAKQKAIIERIYNERVS